MGVEFCDHLNSPSSRSKFLSVYPGSPAAEWLRRIIFCCGIPGAAVAALGSHGTEECGKPGSMALLPAPSSSAPSAALTEHGGSIPGIV